MAGVEDALAGRVDVVDAIGEMAEIAATAIALLVPIVGELDLRRLVARRCQEDQAEAAFVVIDPADLAQTDQP